MKSPFPGMDPYLEARWGDVHARVATYASDQLNRRLPSDLVARSDEYVAIDLSDEDRPKRYAPDVYVTEYPEVPLLPMNSAMAVAEPIILRIADEPQTLRRVLIHDIESGNRVITAIEFLSRWNKIGVEGRSAYRQKRRQFLERGTNFIEIDLLRDGQYTLFPPQVRMRGRLDTPYRACVIRAANPIDVEIYPFPLPARLPSIRVPLRRTDADVALDLQALIDLVYENGRYALTIDYKNDPDPTLSAADAAWADERLKAAGKR